MSIVDIICSICTDVFINSSEVYGTNCGHLFHLGCLNNWQTRQRNCPQCRSENPTTFKLCLSFDESEQVSQLDPDILIKIQSSDEKITELQQQLQESERMFLQLQKQFTKAEESKREAEEVYSQIVDKEIEFLKLQERYTDSSELAKELEDRINQTFILNECKSEELELVLKENERLKARLRSEQRQLPDDVNLSEKLKNLEIQFKNVSELLETESNTNTQLFFEKHELQRCVTQLQNSEGTPKGTAIKKCFENVKNRVTTLQKETRMTNDFEKSSIKNDEILNAVVIKLFPLNQLRNPLTDVVINMALNMKMDISVDDLIKVIRVPNKNKESKKAQIYVRFKSSLIRDMFISKMHNLRNDPIFNSTCAVDLQALYIYAQNKLQTNGFNVFYKNFKIFTKRNDKPNADVIIIQYKNQIDNLVKKYTLDREAAVKNME